jgi:hypothetical protein
MTSAGCSTAFSASYARRSHWIPSWVSSRRSFRPKPNPIEVSVVAVIRVGPVGRRASRHHPLPRRRRIGHGVAVIGAGAA